MQITMKKTELLAKLNDKLAQAKAYDVEQVKKHEADERAALKKFRVALKTAASWNWKKVKENHYRAGIDSSDVPRCPFRSTGNISYVIQMVKASGTDRFSVRNGTDIHRAVFWERPDKTVSNNLCD